MKRTLFFLLILGGSWTFAQTKAELQAQIDKQARAIDSLNAVIVNYENIVENRDRSIKFLNMDVEECKKEQETLNTKIRQKNTELVKLRNQNKAGEVKKVTMNNTRASWTVPAGKHWVINQFIGDYITDLTQDSTGNWLGKEIHVFLKSINNTTLTDASKNMFGPQVFSSVAANQTMQFPIIFTENTSFSIVVYKGSWGALELYDGSVVCTYYEKDN